MAAAPPLMASGALALMLGLDVALAVVVTTFATALMPLTVPPIALHLLGVGLDIALGELTLRLALVVGGCFVAAVVLRRLLPPGFAARHAEPLDGLAVLGLLLFSIAIMDGATAMRSPAALRAGCALAVYGLNLASAGPRQRAVRLARRAPGAHHGAVQRQRQSRPAAGGAGRSRRRSSCSCLLLSRSCRFTPYR